MAARLSDAHHRFPAFLRRRWERPHCRSRALRPRPGERIDRAASRPSLCCACQLAWVRASARRQQLPCNPCPLHLARGLHRQRPCDRSNKRGRRRVAAAQRNEGRATHTRRHKRGGRAHPARARAEVCCSFGFAAAEPRASLTAFATVPLSERADSHRGTRYVQGVHATDLQLRRVHGCARPRAATRLC